jgi:hypothetical protein
MRVAPPSHCVGPGRGMNQPASCCLAPRVHRPSYPLHYTRDLRSHRVCIITVLRVCCFHEEQVAYDAYCHRRRASRNPALAP